MLDCVKVPTALSYFGKMWGSVGSEEVEFWIRRIVAYQEPNKDHVLVNFRG